MAIRLDELLKRIPSDTAERVERARRRLNLNIREALRQETALKLGRSLSAQEVAGANGRRDSTNVPVRCRPGLPVALQHRAIDEQHRLAVVMAPWRESLRSLRDASATVSSQVAPLLQHTILGDLLLQDRDKALPEVHSLAEDLLRTVEQFDLVAWILEIDQDVLGIYSYHALYVGSSTVEAEIHLYWAVLGLIAQVLGVPVEDLTGVVLAHELAHAYTHLGFDIDGHRWLVVDFQGSEHALKEGLAQYYTARVCERLLEIAPGMKYAYEALLPRQPQAYQSHALWIKHFHPEEVRLAMLQTRRAGAGTLEAFETALDSAGSRLSPGSGTSPRRRPLLRP